MKTVSFLLSLFFMHQTFAAPSASIEARILPHSEIESVRCWSPQPVSHEVVSVGEITVRAESGRRVVMHLVVFRLSDMDQEAKALCENASSSVGRPLDIIFTEQGEGEGTVEMSFKGAYKLYGLNPLFNG
jgi:hypothetical protein